MGIVTELKRASITDSDTTMVRGNTVGAADRYEIRITGGHERQPGLLYRTEKELPEFPALSYIRYQYPGNRLPRVISIDPRTLPRILRIEGLIPFTISAILLGFAVTWREVGFSGADWRLFTIAWWFHAHIWNDIMDLEIDRHEKSRKPARATHGWATVE